VTLVRLLDQDREAIALSVDGQEVAAKRGDTVLTAILAAGLGAVRRSEFGDGPRAGFCWMGACQDCWIIVEDLGTRRACTTPAEPGMRVVRR
jgi:predicted molibdopterin-dependent oxidoreductase YjgC